jgi:hypothetical protein
VRGVSRDSMVELPLGPQSGPRPVEPGASWSRYGLSTLLRSKDADDGPGLKSCSSEGFILFVVMVELKLYLVPLRALPSEPDLTARSGKTIDLISNG